MKHTLTLVAFALFFSFTSNAQTKTGTVDSEYIISKMPQLKTVQTRIEKYGAKLDSSFQVKLNTYKEKVTAYNKVSETLAEADKKTKVEELATLDNDLKLFRTNGTKMIQLQRDEYMRPLYKKLSVEISAIAKANGYSQILTITGNEFAYLDPKFDITKLVMAKMGIKE